MDSLAFFPADTQHHTPNWQSPGLCDLSPGLQEWLLDDGSLTARLKEQCQHFHVQVLRQYVGQASIDEYRALSLEPESVTIREVLLWCGNQPWVFARSILPHQQLNTADQLTELGNQPLGEQLFEQPDMAPGLIQVAPFSPESGPGQLNIELHGHSQQLWGRRRPFWLGSVGVLVAEVFLSPVPCYAQA